MWHANSQISQGGFSMIEVLVAMLIVPIGLLGVAKFQSSLMIVSAETKTRSQALYAATSKIEELRAFANNTDYGLIASGSDTIAASAGSNAALTRSWTITDVASPNYKIILVNVGWTASNNQADSVSLTSYISMADPVASGKRILN